MLLIFSKAFFINLVFFTIIKRTVEMPLSFLLLFADYYLLFSVRTLAIITISTSDYAI